jgi:tetratricopeptide (TPR) repeat protein
MNCLGFIYETQYRLELAEKYYLMATTNHNCPNAMYNLGDLYEKQRKFDLAAKYYLKAISFNVGTVKNIAGIIPKISHDQQLDILELVVQIRSNEVYFMNISEEVRTIFANKKMEMIRCLSNYLIDDLVDICVNYY